MIWHWNLVPTFKVIKKVFCIRKMVMLMMMRFACMLLQWTNAKQAENTSPLNLHRKWNRCCLRCLCVRLTKNGQVYTDALTWCHRHLQLTPSRLNSRINTFHAHAPFPEVLYGVCYRLVFVKKSCLLSI